MSASTVFSYMHLANIQLVESLYSQFQKDPTSIDSSWRHFFEGMEFANYQKGGETSQGLGDLRVYALVDAYRRYGHLLAHVNPIEINPPKEIEELSLESLGFAKEDLNKIFPTYGFLMEKTASLSEIIKALEETYCAKIGVEYMNCSHDLVHWIQEHMESVRSHPNFSIEKKIMILNQLNKSELFEIFLHTKYVGQKRFSLEGGETLIPILSELIEEGANLGVEEFVIGMAHRGRLNVLSNILNKSYSMIFSEFEDYFDSTMVQGAGDVKYHKGYSSSIETSLGKSIQIGLTPNASHLESIDPVVEGKVLAKQIQSNDGEKKRIIPLLIHGDASIAGQGVVYETFQLNDISGYSTGGTIHIIVNNQIGFTALPGEYRSSQYSSDIAHVFGLPVFHVNAEDPEACVFVAQLAMKMRQLFHVDVIIDLHCYRKYGHNEGDEPFFTQPLVYRVIKAKKSIRELYRDHLVHQGSIEGERALDLEEKFNQALHYELEEFKVTKESISEEPFRGVWSGFGPIKEGEIFLATPTGVDLKTLQEIGRICFQIPEGFEMHSKLKRVLENRRKMSEGALPIDWAMGELLAFGTLLLEKAPVRLSGQDCQRGTFTQRHAVWVDQNSGASYFPLAHLKDDQGKFSVYNSSLSEFAIVGFEFGYSLAYPSSLVLWEAQYGDFANGAQIIFDQYLSCSEQKWQRYSGLVLLLPHGYEGGGAEHSSARMERFLQLTAKTNMQIVYPTTPAQYFHLLRRQVKRSLRLPLVVFTPKKLLRHSECVSSLEDFSTGAFQEILDDPKKPNEAIRLILCTGRIYYDLMEERKKRNLEAQIAIVRIEQLYPLYLDRLSQILLQYKSVKDFLWVQEEPQNMGAYHYLFPILQGILQKKGHIQYVGREASAATAISSHARHQKEQEQLINVALRLE